MISVLVNALNFCNAMLHSRLRLRTNLSRFYDGHSKYKIEIERGRREREGVREDRR